MAIILNYRNSRFIVTKKAHLRQKKSQNTINQMFQIKLRAPMCSGKRNLLINNKKIRQDRIEWSVNSPLKCRTIQYRIFIFFKR